LLLRQGGALAANGAGAGLQQRRVSRRDSFGLPDSLDLGTLEIDPGKPLSEGSPPAHGAHMQPQQQQPLPPPPPGQPQHLQQPTQRQGQPQGYALPAKVRRDMLRPLPPHMHAHAARSSADVYRIS
jgi:hypothetical protein